MRVWDIRKQRCTATHHIKQSTLHASGLLGAEPTADGGRVKASCYTLAVNSTFTRVYTGHSTGMVAVTDVATGRVEPLLALPSPCIAVHLDERDHRLWTAAFDSDVTAYDIRPSLTRHRSFDADDPDDEDDDDVASAPLTPPPTVLTLPGIAPLKRARITGDGWHVLTLNSTGHVHLFDITSQRLIKSYGYTPFDPLLTRKNAAAAPSSKPVIGWFSVDVRLGCLCVTLDRRNAWSAVHIISSPPLPEEGAEQPDDVVVNLGETAVGGVLSEWVGLEWLAVAVQSGLEWDEDGIEEGEEPLVSPLLSPPRHLHRTNSSPSQSLPPSSLPITGVRLAVIISYPRTQRRPPLYLSLPLPSLPTSLSPHSPSLAEDRALELDRRRAIYYASIPAWVEQRVMGGMERGDRPPDDFVYDVMVNVRDWVGGGGGGEDGVGGDGEGGGWGGGGQGR